MMSGLKTAWVALLAGYLSACGQDARTEPIYVKSDGWDSICLARMVMDMPPQVEVAAANAVHSSGYGFDPELMGAATSGQFWNHIDIQETKPALMEDFQDIRDSASFRNSVGVITKYKEAALGSKYAYGFHLKPSGFDIGYIDPEDKRIRLFKGGLPGDKPDGAYTAHDVSAYYQEIRRIYTARKPTDIPAYPGICSPYGFFKDPASGPVANYDIDVAVRSLKYPNLIIFVHIRPPEPTAPKSLDELRDPNNITVDDLKSIKGIGAIGAILALGNVKRLHDPQKLTIAGQPARLSAREYHHKGTLDTAGSASGAAYEMQADTVGVQGQADMPAITIKLAAALPDPFPYPPPVHEMVWGEEKITYYKPSRPALKGVKTPPFDEAMVYFKQVLASVRPLSQGHGQASAAMPASPAAPASAAIR